MNRTHMQSEHVDRVADRLSHWELFAEVEQADLQRLAQHVRAQSCAAGHIVAWEGEPCTALYLVEEGALRLKQLSAEGREYILGHVRPGECTDLVALFDGSRHIATAEALVPTELWVVPRAPFADFVHSHASLLWTVAQRLAEQSRHLSENVKVLALHPVRARLAHFLVTHAENQPPQHYWTQEAVAAHIGTVRDVVGRILRAFAEEGLIRRERGKMVIANRAALEREAQLV